MRHAERTVDQIAEPVAQFRIVTQEKALLAEIGVATHDGIPHEVITKRCGSVERRKHGGIDDVSGALAHLFPAKAPESVHQKMRHPIIGKSHGMQHAGPVDTVCGNEDVLADDMMVAGPALFKVSVGLLSVAGKADVIDQCIEPDIGDKTRVERQFYTPGQATLGA